MTKICSRCKSEKLFSEYGKHSGKSDGLQTVCKACKKITNKSYYEKDKIKHRARIKNNRRQRRQRLTNLKLKNPCIFCGESEPCCLEFHHLKDKSYNISHQVDHLSWKTILKEIEKCVLICLNCHRKVHAGILRVSSVNVAHLALNEDGEGSSPS